MVTENMDKLHFGHLRMKDILDFMIATLRDGLHFGGDYGSQIVNYSNSQLKTHSIWMLVKSRIPEIQLDRIIQELGTFD